MLRAAVLFPPCLHPGDCSSQCDVSAQIQLRAEQQLPECRGGLEAVVLVFCFGFLLLFRVTGGAEPEENILSCPGRFVRDFLSEFRALNPETYIQASFQESVEFKGMRTIKDN